MVSIISLWLPILLSSVIVFVVSSIIHMVLKYHQSDFKGVPNQDQVQEALRKFDIPPGDYMIPHGEGMVAMKDPAFLEKYEKGPVVIMTVVKSGVPSMAGGLIQWFLYSILVGIISAYVASRAVGLDTYYLEVFRFVGVTAFTCYSIALLQSSIWYKRKWSSTIKSMFDGLIYALLTAGTFGWLWPGI